jgi:hypothetical protein
MLERGEPTSRSQQHGLACSPGGSRFLIAGIRQRAMHTLPPRRH